VGQPEPFRYRIPRRRPPVEPWTPERIAALRAGLGLSQAAFAEELGVRQQTVSEWETGRYQPRGATARMLTLLAEARSPYDAGRGPR
jgi:DNA-binding transcriptional regulator YiaG